MEDLTTLFLLLSIGLFVGRYFVRREGMDYLTVLVSVCSMATTMLDSTIAEEHFLILLIPSVFVMMVTLCGLAFDKEKRY